MKYTHACKALKKEKSAQRCAGLSAMVWGKTDNYYACAAARVLKRPGKPSIPEVYQIIRFKSSEKFGFVSQRHRTETGCTTISAPSHQAKNENIPPVRHLLNLISAFPTPL